MPTSEVAGCPCGQDEVWGLPPLKKHQTTQFIFGWKDLRKKYQWFRFILAVYWGFWTIFDGCSSAYGAPSLPSELGPKVKDGPHWLIYITDWSMVVEAAYLLMAWLVTVYPDHQGLVKGTWVLRNIAVPASVMVMVLYWALDFNGHTNAIDVHEHIINAVLMLTDLTVSRWPFFLRHFYMPLLYTLVYCIFNACYVVVFNGTDAEGNHYIYEVLNYQPMSDSIELILVIVLVFFPLVYILLYWYSRGVHWVFRHLCIEKLATEAPILGTNNAQTSLNSKPPLPHDMA